MDNKNANAFFNRGCCFDSNGELDLAIQDYSRALDLDQKSQPGDQKEVKFEEIDH